MTDFPDATWLTVPDLAERLDLKVTQVHRLLEDRALIGARIDGVLRVPESFIADGGPLHELRGTLLVLHDAGYGDEESLRWLLTTDDALEQSPIDALRAGRKSAVRRAAQLLAF